MRRGTWITAGGAAIVVVLLVAGVLGAHARQPGDPANPRAPTTSGHSSDGWVPTSSPAIDPREGDIPFGYRSQWLQPWRAYLTTPPATVLRDGLGVNFNATTSGPFITDSLRLLAGSGIRLARLEVGWNSMSYAHPSHLAGGPHLAQLTAELQAMKHDGIRPLILLNANSGGPTPSLPLPVRLTRSAAAGARSIVVDAASARRIVPGRSGLDEPELQAGLLFTAVRAGGVVDLSQPLPHALSAGVHAATTLRFAPFSAPKLPGGSANPAYQTTLRGWMQYAGGVTRWAKATLGGADFDIEIWNELSFGSSFLSQSAYYKPLPYGSPADDISAVLSATVRYLRTPSRGLSGVGITDGFASEEPFASPALSPPGLTALSKHPYHGLTAYPRQQVINSLRSLNALGRPDYTGGATFAQTAHDRFIPHYDALFPEYFLTALQTETLERDLSPTTSEIYGVPHGRDVRNPDGRPMSVWVTEMGTEVSGADLTHPASVNRPSPLDLPDTEHILAKTILRTFCAYINKGVGRVYIYAAFGPGLGMIPLSWVDAVQAGRTPPSAGPVIAAVRRFASTLRDARTITHARPLRLEQVSSRSVRVQFRGDGTAAHPSLLDRDALAFLPFQLDRHDWIAPVYVMTRDVAHAYRGGRSPTRFDLPDEAFRLRIGGLNARTARVSLYDPLANADKPARIVARDGDTITVQLSATDSPRMLRISHG